MSDLAILPVCHCTAYDQPHVHMPQMVDSQYGLRVHLAEEHVAPGIVRLAPAPTTEDRSDG